MEANDEIVTNERLPLLSQSARLKDSIAIKTLAFGLNGLFLASHIAANGKLLSLLGENGTGAAAIASTYYSVILGLSTGFVLSTGFEVGTFIGREQYQDAGDMVKSSWIMTAALGLTSSVLMALNPILLPLIFEESTAKVAGSFFVGYAAAAIPVLMLITSPQVAFQVGDWFIPPITSFFFAAIAGVLGYTLSTFFDLGALGVGLGGCIAAWAVCAGLQAWFTKEHYKPYALYSPVVNNFRSHIVKLLNTGWQLSLQRLTEWGNLMLITTMLGRENNAVLPMIQPSIQYIGVLASSIQSIAQASGMILVKNKGAQLKAKENNDTELVLSLHQSNIKTLIVNNGLGALVGGIIATSFYFAREPLTGFFLSKSISSDIQKKAEDLLTVNMIGLIPDAARIITTGSLRAWKKILIPTIVSLVAMEVIGLPVGWFLDPVFGSKALSMFWVRDAVMLLAALTLFGVSWKAITEDKKEMLPSSPRHKWQFFSSINRDQKNSDLAVATDSCGLSFGFNKE